MNQPVNIYRHIHKAIRVALFDVTAAAGRVDPGDRAARIELVAQLRDVVDFLRIHAAHEDAEVDAAVARVLPDAADAINADHASLEAEMDQMLELGYELFDLTDDGAGDDARDVVFELYLTLADFTSRYLDHQSLEERVVMPALSDALGFEGVMDIHQRIVGGISPEVMAWSLAKMLPAINVDDRTEMLVGMKLSAPPEVFADVLGLAADVLPASDYASLAARIETVSTAMSTVA
jgi:hypothetical protein